MSQTMRWFLGGMMALQRELALFIAPNINSYKRYAVASWAPVNVVWGRDNRTTGFRIVGSGAALHIENRFPGGDMNAYLAYAAESARGCTASSTRSSRRPSSRATATPPRAATACRALCTRRSTAGEEQGRRRDLRPDVVDHYLNAARVERDAYDAAVHAWDRERYLERG
jgi:glutamine synthetase